jgi:putative SOS response-associated peptidase YedK
MGRTASLSPAYFLSVWYIFVHPIMCYHYSPAHLERLQQLYPDKFSPLEFTDYANGFAHPKLPTIDKKELSLCHWGLIPHWTKDWDSAQKMRRFCLNAKIETLAEKPSFRDALEQKSFCALPAAHFYEWQWQDAKGKEKTKFEISFLNNETLHFAGLKSDWLNKETGEVIQSFTIITCAANPFMEKIHNTKKRMPIILNKSKAADWVNGTLNLTEIKNIAQAQELKATPYLEQ